MRVIAGSARSIALHIPEGKEIRPTIDRFKETIFNIIQMKVPNARFLDVFAGSGAMGIEALSRGAKESVFIEHSATSMECIKENLKNTKLFEKAKLLKYDYTKAFELLSQSGEKFDIIFLDPPYDNGFEAIAVSMITQLSLLADNGILIIECSADTKKSLILNADVFEVYKEKVFKTTAFTFARKTECKGGEDEDRDLSREF